VFGFSFSKYLENPPVFTGDPIRDPH
jgi:hypothetical protein